MEPKHPTYGTLEEFLAEVAKTIRRGELVRIGHHGAMNWFSHRYSEIIHRENPVTPVD